MVPALQQISSVELLLFAAQSFPIVNAALPRTQRFENFAAAISLVIFGGGFLTLQFEFLNLGP